MNGKTNLVVSGGCGRMGQAIVRLALEDETLNLIGCLEAAEKISEPFLMAGSRKVEVASELSQLDPPKGTVLIEFTSPSATCNHAETAAKMGIKMVIGTTGLSEADQTRIRSAAENTAIVIAPNMSVGVNALLSIVSRLAELLPEYDIEITEMHHRLKKDAPSGTALALGEAAASGRGQVLEQIARHGRHGMVGERVAGEIGMHAIRGGDVVGDHTVTFAGIGERVEVTHKAHSRDTFAAGALRAAKFLTTKETGLFSMKDVLGLD